MQIQVHTDNHIQGSAALAGHVEAAVASSLGRFGPQVTRVEVFLGDENGPAKAGDADKRCRVEARLAGLQPIAVTHHGATIDQALDGALDKMVTTLDRHLGRLDASRG